ncbi:hypothetical protein [Streptomyces alkaliterrae]|uniref:Uncharacterized protein n=1 Tax=Streptomyces alkaliterrae TaxID=2213162 RepID=A0A5P0YMK8_9ACTN|nr:hypothetical protein [Streptomyces alkaliterrae]MBB1260030.1 hypothetical protein [Streptomyces alkaliterrae]MQS01501.1 hypothetical protein [Streptomyces alkaliterrae]
MDTIRFSSPPSARRRARLALPALMLSLGLLTAACGAQAAGSPGVASVDSGKSASEAGKGGGSGENDPQAFAECMRENGVDMEDPGPEGHVKITPELVDGDRKKLREAAEACREHMPQRQGGGGEMTEEQKESMRKFATCMRDEGVDVPDPEDGGGFRMGPGAGVDPHDSDFKAAMEECRGLLSGGGMRFGGGGQ